MARPTKLDLEDILERATRLFWAEGCDAVSMRDLQDALEVRAPAIYRRFESREALLVQCIQHYIDRVIVGRIEQKLDAADDPIVGLYAFFSSAIEAHGPDGQFRGCLLANTATTEEGRSPDVHAALLQGWSLVDEAFQRHLALAQRSGQIDPALDVTALSQSLLTSLLGLLTLVRAGVTDLRPSLDTTFQLIGGIPKPAPEGDSDA